MKTSLRTVFAVIAIILAPSLGRANIVAQDTYEGYSLGPVAGQGGGAVNGWAGDWTTPAGIADVIDTTSSPLTYYTINGATRAVQNAGSAANSGQVTASRQLGAPFTSSFYVGFLLQYSGTSVFDGNDTFSLYMSDGASATGGNALTVGVRGTASNGELTFMVRKGTGNPVDGGFTVLPAGSFSAGETHLLVAQYVWDGLNYSTINGWLDPVGDPVAPQVTETLVDPTTGKSSIGYAFFRNYDNNNDGASPNDFWTVDNLVIGESWMDVVPVPEPTSMALFGLGAFALVAFRRRKA